MLLNKRFSITIEEDVVDALQALARREDLTTSALVRQVLKRHLRSQGIFVPSLLTEDQRSADGGDEPAPIEAERDAREEAAV